MSSSASDGGTGRTATNLLIHAIDVVVHIACAVIWPRAIRHDRRVGDECMLAGKLRSQIPVLIALVVAVAMTVDGNLLYNSH